MQAVECINERSQVGGGNIIFIKLHLVAHVCNFSIMTWDLLLPYRHARYEIVLEGFNQNVLHIC